MKRNTLPSGESNPGHECERLGCYLYTTKDGWMEGRGCAALLRVVATNSTHPRVCVYVDALTVDWGEEGKGEKKPFS